MPYARKANGSENAIESRKKWDEANLKRVTLAIRSDAYDIAKAIAVNQGKSFNRFVTDLIEGEIDKYINK